MATQPDSNSKPIGSNPIGAATAAADTQPQLAYDDLRQWLDEARRLGEVKDVSGLNWQQDIGMVAERRRCTTTTRPASSSTRCRARSKAAVCWSISSAASART